MNETRTSEENGKTSNKSVFDSKAFLFCSVASVHVVCMCAVCRASLISAYLLSKLLAQV